MIFNGWEGVIRTVLMAGMSYGALLFILRLSGKRTLAKLNAFDLVVTVALGSTLATILLSKDVALAEGVTALLSLVGLQFAVAWTSVRFRGVERLVKSEPTLLVFRGQVLDSALRRERVTRDEVLAALRACGMSRLDEAGAVVLETEGELNVLTWDKADGEAVAQLKPIAAEP